MQVVTHVKLERTPSRCRTVQSQLSMLIRISSLYVLRVTDPIPATDYFNGRRYSPLKHCMDHNTGFKGRGRPRLSHEYVVEVFAS